MGFFLWGVAFGWALCALFWYSQSNEDNKTAGSAVILFMGILIMAIFVSINLGIVNGSIGSNPPTATPTTGGR